MFKKIARPKTATGKSKSPIKTIGSFVIFGFICLMFVFLGVPFGQNSSIGGSVALVNGEVISVRDYQNAMDAMQEQLRRRGGGGSEEEGEQERLRRDALYQLVNMEVMAKSASDFGIEVGLKELKKEIRDYPIFQEEGRFKRILYNTFLESNGYPPKRFERKIQKQIASSALQTLFSRTVLVPKMESQKNSQLQKIRIKVSFVAIPYGLFKPHEEELFKKMVEEDANLKDLNQILKDKEKEWQTTGVFDLRRTRLPKVQGQGRLFQLVIKHLPEKGLIPKVIQLRDQSYVLKIDSFEGGKEVFSASFNKEKEEKGLGGEMSFGLGAGNATRMISQVISSQMLFQSWLSMEKSRSKIKINSRIIGP